MRKHLKITFVQAKSFAVQITQLPPETKRILKEYLGIPHHFFKRRVILLRKGLLKNGFWRNLGLLLFI